MDRQLHDMRNDLAVAIGTLHALIDGKLAPDAERLTAILHALESLDGALPLRVPVPADAVTAKEHLLNAVIEGSPYAKILVDAHGAIVLVNAQTEALFGYSRDELFGRAIDMLVPERFRTAHPRLRNRFGESPVARPMGAGRDLYGLRKDGSEVPIEIGLNPIVTGSETFTLAAITDITERRRAEHLRLENAGMQLHAAELEQLNAELESASRFKTEFVATMSHELRTPLGAIIGASELLAKTSLAANERAILRTISDASEALLALINSVLDFSKIEAGKLELSLETFDLAAVVEAAADVAAQLARNKIVNVQAYVEPGIAEVTGDAHRLRQVLLNLLGNAVKFTDRGNVTVRATVIRESEHAGVRFEIEDTGIGIEEDMLLKLFEPFAQADRSASRRFAGTGLGLSIARRLVELMGGEIGVTSTAGRGSCFWFTVPFALRSGRAPERTVAAGFAATIVTGDDTFAAIVHQYLTSWSIPVARIAAVSDVRSCEGERRIVIIDTDELHGELAAAAERLIENGAISIEVGRGSKLRKPLRQSQLFDAIVDAQSSPAPRPSVRPDAPGAVPVRILVAEDNEQLQRLLAMQFAELGADVTFVGDGKAAMEAVRSAAYAMVFMDCQMPNLDGLDATKLIRHDEHATGVHLPIVAMTANAFAEDREACLRAGMDDYLAKPVKLADLQRMIDRWTT